MANPCPQPQNNIYVGARYVPIFAGPWDKTKTYEPLMIVEYQGNSYTSKTFVPAGVDITNDKYWAVTGNYNAQVEAYRKEVQTVAGQLDSIEADITEIKTTVDEHTASINSINTTLTNHTNNLVSLNRYIDYLSYFRHKKILIFGDSISDETRPEMKPNWVANFREQLAGIADLITNDSTGGRTIAQISSQPQVPVVDAIDNYNLNDYDIVIFFAGINDYLRGIPLGNFFTFDKTTFNGALHTITLKLSQNNCVPFFISPTWTTITGTRLPFHTPNMYAQCIYSYCSNYGFHFIDGYNAPLYKANLGKWSYDNLHPKPEYAPYLMNYIMKGVNNPAQSSKMLERTLFYWKTAPSFIDTTKFTNANSYFSVNNDGTITCRIEGTIIDNGTIATMPTDFNPLYTNLIAPPIGGGVAAGGHPVCNISFNDNGFVVANATGNNYINFTFNYISACMSPNVSVTEVPATLDFNMEAL